MNQILWYRKVYSIYHGENCFGLLPKAIFLSSSITISLLNRLYSWYAQIEQKLITIYQFSQTYGLANKCWKRIKVCFRYSLLGRITEIRQIAATFVVFSNSRAIQCLIDFYKRWKDRMIFYLGISSTISLTEDAKEQFVFSPVKMISAIIFTTVVVNTALSFILAKQIGLWGWLMRGLFLFVGISGLSCQADWSTVKKGSVFLRKSGWIGNV